MVMSEVSDDASVAPPTRPSSRRRPVLLVVAAVVAVGTIGVLLAVRGDDGRTTTSSSGDVPETILPYLVGGDGGEVTVPNGRYSGGSIAAPHDDWLVLRAESPGGVVVDLSDTGLELREGSSKIVFVGFTFVNGMVRLSGVEDVHFWYSDFSFPPEAWARQYAEAGGSVPGDRGVRDEFGALMANPLPTAIRTRAGSEASERVGVFGSDFYDIGDDAIFLADVDGVRLEGLRIWNVDERGADPGQALGTDQDWFHNDGIQTIGGVSDVQIVDSWIGQKIQWGTERGDIVDATFERLWLAGSSTFGQINETTNGGRILDNVQRDIRVFANGQRGTTYDEVYDTFRTDFVDGDQRAVWPDTYFERGVFELPADDVTEGPPAGIAVRDGLLLDIDDVVDHPDNPANRWRDAHPYGTYSEYLLLD